MIRRVLVACIAAVVPLAVSAVPVQAAPTPIVIWADATRAPVLQAAFAKGYLGHPVTVVTKDVTNNANVIRDDLKAVTKKKNAPDIIWADAAWTGDLASLSLIVPMPMSGSLRSQFPKNVLAGFRYASQDWGLPVQSENVALVTNAQLVSKPVQTFAALSKKALALKAKGQADVGLAVAQGPDGYAYFMEPLFSGLGGYFFGTDAQGNEDPADVGLTSKAFRKNAGLIDTWNSSGLINSAVDVEAAKAAFVAGKAPFWITGPWDRSTLKSLTFKTFIGAVPNIVTGQVPAPFLGVRGFMVTSWADQHGVLDDSLKLVRKQLSGAQIQGKIAGLTERTPANVKAPMGKLAAAFKGAGVQGTPYPNIPQAAAVWKPLGKAWAVSTSGPEATPAKTAFKAAQDEVTAALATPAQ